MRSPLIAIGVSATLLVPSLAWACDCLCGTDTTTSSLVGGMSVVAAVASLFYAVAVYATLRFLERHQHVEARKPKGLALGLIGVGLASVLLIPLMYIAGDVLLPHTDLASARFSALVLTTPLVLQSAYAVWSWRRSKNSI